MTNEEKVIRFREIVNDMADLYEKKNKNYGNSFGELFENLGPASGLVPLWNKLHRATSLIKGNKNNFESLEDTFKDLACYSIMNLIEIEAAVQGNTKEEERNNVVTWPKDINYVIKKPTVVVQNTNDVSLSISGNPNIGCGEPILTTRKGERNYD